MDDPCTIFVFDLMDAKDVDDSKTITPTSSSTSLESLDSDSPPPKLRRAWTVQIPTLRANNKHVPSLLKRSESEQSFVLFFDCNL